LGGLLTNFITIQKSIKRFRELETMRSTGQYDLFSKKEVARYERERKKLEKNLSGIKDMNVLPDALFVIDTKLETIAIKEAVKLGIPVVGVADTNCDPDEIDYIIPGNDDALRAIRLITDTIAQAYLDGKAVYEAQQKELAEKIEKQRQLQAQQAAAAREAAEKAAAAAVVSSATDKSGPETSDAQGSSADEKATAADPAAKPKTTVRKTLQRKARPKKPEAAAAGPADAPKDVKAEENTKPLEVKEEKSEEHAEEAPAAGPADAPKDVKAEEKTKPLEVKEEKSEHAEEAPAAGPES
jgi:small subunit ribosomal protein S2